MQSGRYAPVRAAGECVYDAVSPGAANFRELENDTGLMCAARGSNAIQRDAIAGDVGQVLRAGAVVPASELMDYRFAPHAGALFEQEQRTGIELSLGFCAAQKQT